MEAGGGRVVVVTGGRVVVVTGGLVEWSTYRAVPVKSKAVTDGFYEPRRFRNDQTATKPNFCRKAELLTNQSARRRLAGLVSTSSESGKESQVRGVQPLVTSVRDILVSKSSRPRLRHATRLHLRS
ncbi:hypothetical protein ACFE04_015202 [Oxalis oulophora]